MEAVGAAASILALVELAAKIVGACLEYSTAAKNANKDITRLQREAKSLEGVLRNVHELCSAPAASTYSASNEMLETLGNCSTQLKDLYRKLKPERGSKLASKLGVHELRWPLESKHVAKIIDQLERYKSTISLSFQVKQMALIQDMLTALELDNLPSAEGAAFDSFSGQLDPQCHEQTRVELRQQIADWIYDPSSRCIFWLNGAAGTGKSTISRTMAHKYSDLGLLGGNFFFKRGEGDRGNATRLITTIASQMIRYVPLVRSTIREAIKTEPDISGRSMREQFEKLVCQPLKALGSNFQQPIVFIVDALDECENLDHIKLLIQLLKMVEKIENVKSRFFLTSRPELPIRLGFKDISTNSYQGIVLHEIPSDIVRSDIDVYLRHELSCIQAANEDQLAPDWPGQRRLEQLVSISEPLFISAATICRFISDERFDPDGQIETILEYQHIGQTDQLAATYQPVLDSLIHNLTGSQKEKVLTEFRNVVGTIIVAADTLSISSLASLLGVSVSLIGRRLNSLHSVIDVPADKLSPLRLYHLSFRDYLVDESNKFQNFWINEAEAHKRVADACVKLLSTTSCLKRDICGLGKPGIAREDIPVDVLKRCLPPDVQYACKYWIYHLEKGTCNILEGGEVDEFLKRRFLFWVEALCLMGRSYELLGMIEALGKLELPTSTSLTKFLNDAREFTSEYQGIFNSAPLQIYYTGLSLTSKTSAVRILFDKEIPHSLDILPRFADVWEGIAKYHGHLKNIKVTKISPDGCHIASASADGTIKLWDLATGDLRHTLSDHSDLVRTIEFSPDGKILASRCNGGTIKTWNSQTGALLGTSKVGMTMVFFLLFSRDSQHLLFQKETALSSSIMIWDIGLSEMKLTTETTSLAISGQFSSTNKQVALNLIEGVTILLETSSGNILHYFRGGGFEVDWINFTPDDRLLVVTKKSSTTVHYTAIGTVKHEIEACLAVSQSGLLLATMHSSGCFHIRNTVDLALKSALPSYHKQNAAEHVYANFSANDKQFVSWSPAGSMTLWDIDSGHMRCAVTFNFSIESVVILTKCPWAVIQHQDRRVSLLDPSSSKIKVVYSLYSPVKQVASLTLSPDGDLLASASRGKECIEVWNIDTNVLLHTLPSPGSLNPRLLFSPGGWFLASGTYTSAATKIKIWKIGTGDLPWTELTHEDGLDNFTFSPEGQNLATVSLHGIIKLWDLSTGEVVWDLITDTPNRCEVAFNPSEAQLASASLTNLEILNLESGLLQSTFDLGDVGDLAFSNDGEMLAAVSDRGLAVIDLRTRTTRHLEFSAKFSAKVACSAAFNVAIAHTIEKQIIIWDMSQETTRHCIGIDSILKRLSLTEGKELQTERGKISLELKATKDAQNIFISDHWIMVNMEKRLWIPPSYRPTSIDAIGDKIAMGFASGRIMVYNTSTGNSNFLG